MKKKFNKNNTINIFIHPKLKNNNEIEKKFLKQWN